MSTKCSFHFLQHRLIFVEIQPANPGQAASTITEDGVAASQAVAQVNG